MSRNGDRAGNMKTNKSAMKLCKGYCKRCNKSGHHWEPILTTHGHLQMMRCVHCPAALGPLEKCADCNHDLEHHEFDGTLECLIVVPDPKKDGRCPCKTFIIKGLAGVIK